MRPRVCPRTLFFIPLILILLTTTCTSPARSRPGEVPQVKVATITFIEEPDTLNPLYSATWVSAVTRDLWLRSLWNFDADNQPVPQLAVEMPSEANQGITNGGKTITIHLRKDAAWSDGEPVTADDFVFTYEMIMAEQNTLESRSPYDNFVESVQAPDDYTLVVNFTKPYAPWVTGIFDYVLPKHVLAPVFEQTGTLDDATWNRTPTVGVGPYLFSEWQSGGHLSFIRNNHWFGPQPAIERIIIQIMPDEAAQVAAIKTGATDIGVNFNYADIPDIKATGHTTVAFVLSGYVEGWFINFDPATAHPALQDVRVRRALALATDRQRIIQDLLLGLTEPPVSFWDATPPYGNPALTPYPYNLERARALLDDTGWVDSNGNGTRDKNGVELVLRFVTDEGDLHQDVQAVVQQMWAQVGIGSKLVTYPSEIFWSSYGNGGPLATGEYDIAQYVDSTNFPDWEASDYWQCNQIPSSEQPEGSNWQHYCNPQLDALFTQQITATDPQGRLQIHYQIEQIMYDDVVWIGLWKDPDRWAVNQRLTGVKFSGATPFWNVTEWDIVK